MVNERGEAEVSESKKMLRKCPFCGGEAVLAATSICNGYVRCLKCNIQVGKFWNDLKGGQKTWEEYAMEAWNNRKE